MDTAHVLRQVHGRSYPSDWRVARWNLRRLLLLLSYLAVGAGASLLVSWLLAGWPPLDQLLGQWRTLLFLLLALGWLLQLISNLPLILPFFRYFRQVVVFLPEGCVVGSPQTLALHSSIRYQDVVAIRLRDVNVRRWGDEHHLTKTVLTWTDRMGREFEWKIEPIYTVSAAHIAQTIITAHTLIGEQRREALEAVSAPQDGAILPSSPEIVSPEWETIDGRQALERVGTGTTPAGWEVVATRPASFLVVALVSLFFTLVLAGVGVASWLGYSVGGNFICLGVAALLCAIMTLQFFRAILRGRRQVLVILPLGLVIGDWKTGEVWQSIRFADVAGIEMRSWSGGVMARIHYKPSVLLRQQWQADSRFAPLPEAGGKLVAAFTRYQQYHRLRS
ncbi:MAG: hypothetical protein ACLQUY_07305 [Ktedonobacterales bacterium]